MEHLQAMVLSSWRTSSFGSSIVRIDALLANQKEKIDAYSRDNHNFTQRVFATYVFSLSIANALKPIWSLLINYFAQKDASTPTAPKKKPFAVHATAKKKCESPKNV